MNEHSLNDPQLQSFEARLAGAVPQRSLTEQQHLLYQCAFAAGQTAVGRSLRRWKAVAVALVALLLGVSVPLGHDRLLIANRNRKPIGAAEGSPRDKATPLEIAVVGQEPATVELDAWQSQPSPSASLAAELARFERTDPHLRSLAVGTLNRAVAKP
jgi:hypothetical protein